MRILMLSYAVVPAFAGAFGSNCATNSAGWVVGIHNSLERADCDVAIVSPMNVVSDTKATVGKTTYYAIPANPKDATVFNPAQIDVFKNVLADFKPDVVTVFGTEYTQGYAMLLACQSMGLLDKTLIFIQGLISYIARYYAADVPEAVVHHRSLRERINHMDVSSQIAAYRRRGENEEKMLRLAKHVIGGTVWDRTVVRAINPNVEYHYCPEILRNGFYENRWDIDKCDPHTIFAVPSSFYPVKGFHYLLEGMREVVKKYPDAKLRVTMNKPRRAKTLKEKLFALTYEDYTARLLDEYNLSNNVEFLGILNEEKLIEQYLRANVFVCASSIENHSQTVSEAKILGVPTVASFVGGVTERIVHGVDGFHYQHNAPYMISEYVDRIFSDRELALSLSEKAHNTAARLVDKIENSNRILAIYAGLL